MKQRRLVAMIAGGAIAAATLAVAPSAQAANSGDTTATFTLANGNLSISAPTAASLSNWSSAPLTGGVSVSGPLGSGVTTVTDERNVTTGWTVSAGSTDFTSTTDSVGAANVTISVDTATSVLAGGIDALSNGLFTGSSTTGSAGGAIGTLTNLTTFLGSTATGLLPLNANNQVSYTPSVTVKIPPDTANGDYTATITQTAT